MRSKDEAQFLRAFGHRIAVGRKQLGLTQAELAEKVGIAPTYIASIETGRRWPHLTIIHEIANALGTTPYGLVSDTEEKMARSTKKVAPLTI